MIKWQNTQFELKRKTTKKQMLLNQQILCSKQENDFQLWNLHALYSYLIYCFTKLYDFQIFRDWIMCYKSYYVNRVWDFELVRTIPLLKTITITLIALPERDSSHSKCHRFIQFPTKFVRGEYKLRLLQFENISPIQISGLLTNTPFALHLRNTTL